MADCPGCNLSARIDHRSDALVMIACRSGPEFLKRCSSCESYWLETLRFKHRLDLAEAERLFGQTLADGAPV